MPNVASPRWCALALSAALAACAVDRAGQAPRDDADGGRPRDAAPRDDAAPPDLGAARCGDGVREGAEACDGDDLDGASCGSAGFLRGTLGCDTDCRLDTAGCANPPADWRDTACPHRRLVTVPAGRATEPLADFPLLVTITDTGLLDHALASGEDLFFADAETGARLPHAREAYDPATGALAAWVRVPLGGPAATRLHLYYGDRACGAATPNTPTEVWDADFRGVWLLAEDGARPRLDATAAAFHATRGNYDGDEDVPGRIAGAERLDGFDDHLALPLAVLEGFLTFTVCVWLRTDEDRSNATNWKNPTIFGQISTGLESADFGVFTESGRVGLRSGLCARADERSVSMTMIRDGDFHQVCAIGGPEATVVTVDDVQVAAVCPVTRSIAPPTFWLGGQRGQTVAETGSHHRGDYDHLEVSGVVRSAAWRSARYANQRDPAAFVVTGPEETW